MFKKTSQNAQGRVDRSVLAATANTQGIDLEVWKDDLARQRDSLVRELHQLEHDIGKINFQLREGARQFRVTGKRIPPLVMSRWQTTKQQYLDQKVVVTEKLQEIKRQSREVHNTLERERDEEYKNLGDTFMKMAKELLAGPVYERILYAAIHRLHDDAETQ